MMKSAMIESQYRPEVTDDAVCQMSFFRSVWTESDHLRGLYILTGGTEIKRWELCTFV